MANQVQWKPNNNWSIECKDKFNVTTTFSIRNENKSTQYALKSIQDINHTTEHSNKRIYEQNFSAWKAIEASFITKDWCSNWSIEKPNIFTKK